MVALDTSNLSTVGKQGHESDIMTTVVSDEDDVIYDYDDVSDYSDVASDDSDVVSDD